MSERGRHVVLTSGRSGSNHLVATLNQHPELVNYGEVLGAWMAPARLHERFGYGGRTHADYLDHTLASRRHFVLAQAWGSALRMRRRERPQTKRWSRIRTVGVKDFSIHFHRLGLVDYLGHRPDIRVVHLVRTNQLRRALSLHAMRRTGVVKVAPGEASERPVLRPDPTDLVALIDRLEGERADEERLVGRLDPARVLRIRFEDYVATPASVQAHADSLFAFLGLDPVPVRSPQRRILPVDLAATVANHEELADALRAGGHARYLTGA